LRQNYSFLMRKGVFMDFQKVADSYYPMTSILSVEKTPDGKYGEIRVVAGNKKYIDVVEHPKYEVVPGMSMKDNNKFVPNSLYSDYIPKDTNFEDLCYRAAVLKEPVHTFVHPSKLNLWFNVFVIPIDYEDGNLCYCAYSTQMTDAAHVCLTSSHSPGASDEVLRTCIKLHGANDFSSTLSEVVHDIRELCKAEVCTIMLLNPSNGTCSILAKSVRVKSTLKTATDFINFYDLALSWLETLSESDCIIIKDEKDMEYISRINHMWWLTLDEAGVKSVVMFPLQYNGEIMGFIWATNYDTDMVFQIKEILELTTYFISSQIANYNMVKRLEFFGFTDMLTGVQNRNAMNNRITAIVNGEEYISVPFGIVFTDLNGLKVMNDTQGHSAGDILLKKAGILLQEIFVEDEVYRAGGDEFVVIVTNCTKEKFDKKIQALRAHMDMSNDVSLAVGYHYVSSGCDIRTAMRLADENMYVDKREYYKNHPKNDRRLENRD